jgi:hypothetical protein
VGAAHGDSTLNTFRRTLSSALCTALTDALTAAIAEHGLKARVYDSADGWYHVLVRGPEFGPEGMGGKNEDACEAVLEIMGAVQVMMARELREAWPSRVPLAPPVMPGRTELVTGPEPRRRLPDILKTWRASMPEPHVTADGGRISAWYGDVDRPDLALPQLPLP